MTGVRELFRALALLPDALSRLERLDERLRDLTEQERDRQRKLLTQPTYVTVMLVGKGQSRGEPILFHLERLADRPP